MVLSIISTKGKRRKILSVVNLKANYFPNTWFITLAGGR